MIDLPLKICVAAMAWCILERQSGLGLIAVWRGWPDCSDGSIGEYLEVGI